MVRSICPYCGVGCQLDLHVKDNTVMRVISPWIEDDTPNQGSTCVKGRFGLDFTMHRDRLTKPLIRRGWVKNGTKWVYDGPTGEQRRGGPWRTIGEEGQLDKPKPQERAQGKKLRDLPVVERMQHDLHDRALTPASPRVHTGRALRSAQSRHIGNCAAPSRLALSPSATAGSSRVWPRASVTRSA